MPRYFDGDALLSKMPDDLPYKSSVKRVLMQAPSVDVASKSEVEELLTRLNTAYEKIDMAEYDVERLEQENEALKDTNEHLAVLLAEAKSDVASEIFEEIYEDCFDQFGYIDYAALAELKKKYTEGE